MLSKEEFMSKWQHNEMDEDPQYFELWHVSNKNGNWHGCRAEVVHHARREVGGFWEWRATRPSSDPVASERSLPTSTAAMEEAYKVLTQKGWLE